MVQTAQGFLLLTLHDVEASLPANTGAPATITSHLALECITIPVARSEERDVWLVVRIAGYEMPILPTQVIKHDRVGHVFTFVGSGIQQWAAEWSIRVRPPASDLDEQDLETFEVILAQYAAMEEYPAEKVGIHPPATAPLASSSTSASIASAPSTGAWEDGDLRGKLVLVDEADGKVVGTLGEQYDIKEDDALHARGKEKDPVIIDIPEDDQGRQEVVAHPIDYYEKDFIMKSASLISRGIVLATGAVATGMSSASSYYIAHTKPNEKPLEFSESTRGHVRRIHKISGQAVTVSSKTTALIGECVDRAVGYIAGGSDQKTPSRPTTPTPSASTSRFSFFASRPSSPAPPIGAVSSPTLPPRNASARYLSPQPQPHSGTITPSNANAPPPLPPRPPLKNRILLSTDLLLTTIENSAKHLVEHGSTKLSEALGHKYGKDMGEASLLVGHSVRNVGLVYIDARGVGRRALLKKAGKKFIRAKLGKKDVVLGVDDQGRVAPPNPAARSTI